MIDKKIYRDGPYSDFICQGVQHGNILYISGQVGMDAAGHIPDTLAEQVSVVYDNIKHVLNEYGANMDNIVDEMMLLTDMDDCMANVNEVFGARQKAYGKKPDVTQTMVAVAALMLPALKVEIKVVAHL